ncbi:recombination-associated protein RdgC [Dongshaea marina]|uniref:recombination-associated protein RdgC n=1 Tax=Dongshaea marina TaxID=2047966 RepID=UPI000D3E6B6D|nr:recombination-associated protein RdgC [Dongshaea marina]
MWFKNIQLYRFSKPFSLSAEELEKQLAQDQFTPCGSQDLSRFGWSYPMGKEGQLFTHVCGNNILICAKKESKILPASVIREEMQEKIEHLEIEHNRPLKKKEKEAIKEEVTQTLLPRAFSRSERVFAWINPEQDLIAVDCASIKKAEELLSLLRKSIGSVPVIPFAPQKPAEVTMTDWIKNGQLPAGFEVENEAELRAATDEGAIIRCRHQDLSSDEILSHLEAGKWVTKLALNWRETLSFVLGDDLSLRRLKFSDEFKEQLEEHEDPAARFDSDFALMTGELSSFFSELFTLFAAEQTEPSAEESSQDSREPAEDLPW